MSKQNLTKKIKVYYKKNTYMIFEKNMDECNSCVWYCWDFNRCLSVNQTTDIVSLRVQFLLISRYFDWDLNDEKVYEWVMKYRLKFREVWNNIINWWEQVCIEKIEWQIYQDNKSAWVAINHEPGEELALAA